MEGRPRMIPRYTRPQMARIFAPEEKLGVWLDVELAAAEAMAGLGHGPAHAVGRLKARVVAERAPRGRRAASSARRAPRRPGRWEPRPRPAPRWAGAARPPSPPRRDRLPD